MIMHKLRPALVSNGGQVQRDDDDHDVAQGDASTTTAVIVTEVVA